MQSEGSFESAVGITSYLHHHEGVKGILKQRFSDFVVREVSMDGRVVRLDKATYDNAETIQDTYFSNRANTLIDGSSLDPEVIIAKFSLDLALVGVQTIVSKEDLDKFLYEAIIKDENCLLEIIPFEASTKQQRTEIHMSIKRHLGDFVDSQTIEEDSSPKKIRLLAKHKTKKGQKRVNSNTWPEIIGNYIEFTLIKENIDTMTAMNFLSKILHVKETNIGYAGSKDKRGVTLQRCTVFRMKPMDLIRINKSHGPFVRVGDFSLVSKPKSLGDLKGNHFEIILRNINQSNETIDAVCETVRSYGFINYFGLQRFGKGGSHSHDVGRQVYKSNWKAAVDLMFQARDWDPPDLVDAKLKYRAGQYSSAVTHLATNKYYSEKLILASLSKFPNDFAQAYDKIPRKTRLICAHAFQSYLWNKVASRRIEFYGLTCVVGDLVAIGHDTLLNAEGDDEDIDDSAPVEDALVDGDGLEPLGKQAKIDSSSSQDQENNSFQQQKSAAELNVHVVSAEDLASNKFTIRDVILPILGAKSIFPANDSGDYYQQLLHEEDINLAIYTSCLPQYRTAGAYRRLLQRADDFEWAVKEYQHPDEEIVETEVSFLKSKVDRAVPGAAAAAVAASDSSISSQPLKALSLKFTLPPGTYATMLLREITKESTESQYQSNLTALTKKIS